MTRKSNAALAILWLVIGSINVFTYVNLGEDGDGFWPMVGIVVSYLCFIMYSVSWWVGRRKDEITDKQHYVSVDKRLNRYVEDNDKEVDDFDVVDDFSEFK